MSEHANKRLDQIALALCPHKPISELGNKNWKHREWIRGFTGLRFIGYTTTIAYDEYTAGANAFSKLTTTESTK